MTSPFFFVAASLAVLTSAAFADGPIVLKSSNGQKIQIWYASPKYYTDGNSANSTVDGVHVVVDGGIPGTTRVVLINNCAPSSSYSFSPSQTVYNCAYGANGTWLTSDFCSVQTSVGGGSTSSAVTVWAANHGGELNCYQQIAVSPEKDKWLKDSVNGQSSNFNFRFPIGR